MWRGDTNWDTGNTERATLTHVADRETHIPVLTRFLHLEQTEHAAIRLAVAADRLRQRLGS